MRLQSWMQKQSPFYSLLWVIPAAIIFELVYLVSIVLPLTELFPKPVVAAMSSNTASSTTIIKLLKVQPWALVTHAAFEECMFRVFTFVMIAILFRIATEKEGLLNPGHIISQLAFNSIVFGYIHGNVLNILAQGMGGMILSLIFLKYGGFNFIKTFKIKHLLTAFLAATLCHSAFNGLLIAGAYFFLT